MEPQPPPAPKPASASSPSPARSPFPASPKNDTWRAHTSFFRDAKAWDWLENVGLFRAACRAARERRPLRVWSCGCSSGEELYSLAMLYESRAAPALRRALGAAPALESVGTDMKPELIALAGDAGRVWTAAALKTVPPDVLAERFVDVRGDVGRRARRLKKPQTIADALELKVEDIAAEAMESALAGRTFDLVLCRYSAFLYSDAAGARRALERIEGRMAEGAQLLVGATDNVPRGGPLVPLPGVKAYGRPGEGVVAKSGDARLSHATLDAFCRALGVPRPRAPPASEPETLRLSAKKSTAILEDLARSLERKKAEEAERRGSACRPSKSPRRDGAPPAPPPAKPAAPSEFLRRVVRQAAEKSERLKSLRRKMRAEWRENARPPKKKARRKTKRPRSARVNPHFDEQTLASAASAKKKAPAKPARKPKADKAADPAARALREKRVRKLNAHRARAVDWPDPATYRKPELAAPPPRRYGVDAPATSAFGALPARKPLTRTPSARSRLAAHRAASGATPPTRPPPPRPPGDDARPADDAPPRPKILAWPGAFPVPAGSGGRANLPR